MENPGFSRKQMENPSDFYTSLIRATKTYVGNDPLLPWLEGINKIKEVLQPEVAKQKLPRFLEKCAQTFLTSKRYKNDLRYLQVWIQLLEFVPNRREALSVMENNQIGLKHALYYQAYALHYEKLKKFPEADAMFRLGIQRFAHPTESLHQSYDAFLGRMASRNRRKLKSLQARSELPSKNIHYEPRHFVSHADIGIKEVGNEKEVYPKGEYQFDANSSLNHQAEICNNVEKSCPTWNSIAESASNPESSTKCKNDQVECSRSWSPETLEQRSIVVSSDKSTGHGQICDEVSIKSGRLFDGTSLLTVEDGEANKEKVASGVYNIRELETVVDSKATLVSNSNCEDTIKTCESLDCAGFCSTKKVEDACHNVLIDACQSQHVDKLFKKGSSKKTNSTMPAVEIIQILPDENLEDPALIQQPSISSEFKENNSSVPADKKLGDSVPAKGFKKLSDECFEGNQEQRPIEGNRSKDNSSTSIPAEVFQEISIVDRELNKECRTGLGIKNQRQSGEGAYTIASFPSKSCSEDTIIVRKFVDSAIVCYTGKVEDAYHHGLVEPTINTKEAMADINDMFGKPLNFEKLRTGNRSWRRQTNKATESFQVLADEDLKKAGSTKQCLLSDTLEGHTSISPFSQDLQVFVDEDLMHSSSKEVPSVTNSSKNLAPVKHLQILADNSFNENQNVLFMQRNTCEDGELSTVAEVFQDGLATEGKWDKNGSSSERENGHGQLGNAEEVSMHSKFSGEDTIAIRKFVDSAIDYDSKELEIACHHGLVDPTINTKEAMAEINDMFGKPLNFDKSRPGNQPWRRQTNKPIEIFQVLADEYLEEPGSTEQCLLSDTAEGHTSISPFSKDLQVFVDENLMHSPSKEVPNLMHSPSKEVPSMTNSSKNIAPVKGLQILADNSFNENQNVIFFQRNTCEDGELSTVQDGLATEGKWDKNSSSSERKSGHGQLGNAEEVSMHSKFSGEDTIAIRKFVDSAIDGDSKELEVACHHGLVDPTINTKEAMEEINNMFWKPLQFDKLKERNRPAGVEILKQPTETFRIFTDENLEEQDSPVSSFNDFEVFIDENLMNGSLKKLPRELSSSVNLTPFQGLQMLSDENFENKTSRECNTFKDKGPYVPVEVFQARQVSATVSLPPNSSSEDTIIVKKFVDSAIVGTEVEGACHHGLVEPTINTKEAMAEINDMFGKPLDFHNTKRSCTLKPETIMQTVKSSPISANGDSEKKGLMQQHHLPGNLEEHDSAIPLDKGFQIFIDEDVHCESTKNHKKKSCLSRDIAYGPILTNESSVVLQKKASMECNVSENENVCKPAEVFQVYIDEQFQD